MNKRNLRALAVPVVELTAPVVKKKMWMLTVQAITWKIFFASRRMDELGKGAGLEVMGKAEGIGSCW